MTDPLFVETDGVLNYSQIHSEVVASLSQLTGAGAADGIGVQNSHGVIASAVSTALSNVLGGRGNTLGVTSTSATTISDLLQQAAQAYQRGDQQGAERLRAAADALEGKGTPGSPVGGAPGGSWTGGPGSGAPGGGGDMTGQMGQVLGQVGQQVGQMAQSIAQPLQGLAQGLQQIPQQIMQGVQQATQQASQAAQAAEAAKLKDDDKASVDEDAPKKHEGAEHGEKAERDAPPRRDEAGAGENAPSGRAPVEPAPQPARPAQTRPQAD